MNKFHENNQYETKFLLSSSLKQQKINRLVAQYEAPLYLYDFVKIEQSINSMGDDNRCFVR